MKALPLSSPATGADADIESRLHASISRALFAGELRPGTPLRERALAEMFDCTRGAVRKVLAQLGREGKLELRENRGAFVPRPSGAEIRAVYQARSALEAGCIALLARTLTPAQLEVLRAHVHAEEAAWRAGDREESVRLAGAFHTRLSNMLDNPELKGFLTHLVARTQLFVALYEARSDSHCAPQEHGTIVDALARQDVSGAIDAMLSHLEDVQARVLQHADKDSSSRALRDILGAP